MTNKKNMAAESRTNRNLIGSRRGNEADGCARSPGNPPRYLGGYGPWGFLRYALSLFCCLTALAEDYDPGRFEKEIIVPACTDPVQCEITADGRLFFIERAGALKSVEPVSKKVTTLGTVPVEMTWEVGILGLALERDFARSQQLFLFFSPKYQ